MTEAVIIAGTRTPIGRANRGSLVDVDAFQLGAVVISEVIARSGLDSTEIEDLILAESLQGGGVIGRYVAVELGLSHIPGMALNRHCAAGLSAVQTAAAGIKAGMNKVVLAGGTESLSSMPQNLKRIPGSNPEAVMWMSPSNPDSPLTPPFDMALTVGENAARIAGVSREEADHWAYHSHIRAAAARDAGLFDDEIVAVDVSDGAGGTRSFARDEHPRADTSLEKLASLKPLHPELDHPTVTAGNSAGLNDAAAAVIVTSDDYAAAHGIAPLARIRSWASVGVDPERTGLAPTLAIPKALELADLKIDDIDLFEINEAFTTMAVASTRALGIDHSIANVNGSGCGLGHPIAATGARMVVSMIHELRRRQQSLGVVSMCAGGGMGSAMVLELL